MPGEEYWVTAQPVTLQPPSVTAPTAFGFPPTPARSRPYDRAHGYPHSLLFFFCGGRKRPWVTLCPQVASCSSGSGQADAKPEQSGGNVG